MAILSNINGKFAVDSTGAIQFSGAAGTADYVLVSGGAGAAPTWVDVSTIIGGPYLPLTGGTLAGAGNLVVGGTLGVNGVTTLNAALTGTTATFTKDQNADTTLKLYNPNTGTSAGANMYITNTSANADGLFLGAVGVNAGSGGFIADSGIVGSGTGASGGLVLMAREASSGIRFYTGGYTDLALTINSSQNATFAGNIFARRGSFGTASNFNFDLYCNGNAYINDELTVDDNATFAGNIGIGVTPDTSVRTFIKGSDSGTNNFQILTRNSSDTNILAVRNDGNVGIGTTSPTARLNVKASGSTVDQIAVTHSGNTVEIAQLGQSANGNSAGALLLKTNGGTDTVYLDAAGTSYINGGNVGIGTTSPIAPLHVLTPAVGGIDLTNISRTANNLVRFTNPQYSTSATMGLLLRVFPDSDARQGAGLLMTGGSDNSASNLSLFVSKDDGTSSNVSQSYSALHIAGNTGNVGIGTTSPFSKLVVRTSADHNFEVEETGGELRLSALNNARSANIGLQFAASEFNFLTGNVGIGDFSPGEKLQINGNIRIYNSSNAPYIDFVENGAVTDSKARITMDQIDGSNGTLQFSTESAGTLSTRMIITSGGQLQLQGSSSSLAKSTTQTEWAYIPGNTPGASLMAQNPSGMSSASAGYHIVYGANNSSPYQAFIDVITYQCGSSTTVTVISSTTLNNSPGSRSYSKNSSAVFLNISGAANYNCNIKTTFINFPH